ncbi:putative FAD-binding monooxygenase [Thamnidium elegans]|nr:putative FAD-binding monooxygenase [Thamnidium elegans]
MGLPSVAIIGSGFSGMVAAIQLKKRLNIIAEVFESTNDIGGTWSYNLYPGCACDVPSHLYSFSFELNPNWSQTYSSQKEIHQYMRDVAKKYDVYKQTQFETEVVRITWIEKTKKWEIELKTAGSDTKNQIKYFDFVFSGVGALRVPNVPEEFQTFEGKILHSAYWETDYDLTNKKIAIIGNGTSSVQIIPNIVKKVSHLYSYQRTPTWVTSRNQVSLLQFFLRESRFGVWGDTSSLIARIYKRIITREMTKVLVSKGRSDLLPKLIPTIEPGCKRIGVSDDYLQALCEDNVTINVSPIAKIKGRTIITKDGTETEVDVLCLATGFNTNGFLGDLKVQGRNGVCLDTLWKENSAKTYKTVNIHGFPNFFMMLGPGSGLGHNSVVTNIECQVDYGISMIEYMLKNNITCMDPTEKAQEKFTTKLQSGFKGTTWTSGCNSWYFSETGIIQFLWPKTIISFYFMLKKKNYETDYIKN